MAEGQKRADLQAVAQTKFDDAALLLKGGRYSNAYYLAGYSIEIGLKACIAKLMVADVVPDKAFILAINTHRLRELVGVAGLSGEFKTASDDANFAASWGIVSRWSPEDRYRSIDRYSAEQMLASVADETSGVLPWIKKHW